MTAQDASFDWLDAQEEWERYSAPLSKPERARLQMQMPADALGAIIKSQIGIEGMHCANCSLIVESKLKSLPGVLDVQVHANSKKAHIFWLPEKSKPSAWLNAINALGYQSSLLEGIEFQEIKSKEAKLMLWRFMVAFFCMMQVMMYSAPLYGDSQFSMDPQSIQLLHWAGWVLSLPVLIFSCQPFFRGAYHDMKNFKLSMDLPVTIGMLLTFFLSCAVTFQPNGIWGMETYFDSFTMFASFLLGGRWLEFKLRNKTLGALDALMDRIPKGIERQITEARFETISTHRIRINDILRVQTHQSFPADALLIGPSTWVEESLLNGESNPISKSAHSTVLAGSINLGPPVLIRANKIGSSTQFASIVQILQEAENSKPEIAKIADRVAKPFIAMVLLCALLSAFWWWPESATKALLVASSVLIVTCPCALSLATPSAMIASAGFLAKRGVLMRDLGTLERLDQINYVVFDKTGTLTQNILHLKDVFNSPHLSTIELFALTRALAKHSPHPLCRSLEREESLIGLSEYQILQVKELIQGIEILNFKEMPGIGVEGTVNFKNEVLTLRLGSYKSLPPHSLPSLNGALIESAQVHLCTDTQWLGSFLFDEELRAEARKVMDQLRNRGFGIQIFSGDQASRVHQISQALGIQEHEAHAELSPVDKLHRIKSLQAQGYKVLMVGDGFNDLPVLAGADVSLVFGSATLLAQEVANCVVLNPSLQWVIECLNHAKRTLRVVRQNLIWAFAYNLICIPMALMGYLPSWMAGLGMALSSLGVGLNAYRLHLKPSNA
jgi:P-type Cu2+ transporter